MNIGVVKEIKDKENRVALTPHGARTLVQAGHAVRVESGAGLGSGFADADYAATGAALVTTADAWNTDLVLKVKEPMQAEYGFLRHQILFTYFHLAGMNPDLTMALLRQHTTAIAYETVEDEWGRLPLLAPMSAVAGNMAVSMGSYYLAHFNQGKGIQLGTVLGQAHGKVVIIGDGIVAQHAASTAAGLGAQVIIAGKQREKIAHLEDTRVGNVQFVMSTPDTIAEQLTDADLVVGAVLLHGAKAPHVVTEEMVRTMQPGSVIVDVSIDQGGCIETSRPTSLSDPVFIKHGVIHYCVTNMPGAYPRTATIARPNVTLPYTVQLAHYGLAPLRDDPGFGKGINTYKGYITSKPVAEALNLTSWHMAFSAIQT
jgi:alanine dehydrogenase